MTENRALRGLPVPSFWQLVVIGAALVAAWLVYSKYDGQRAQPDEAVVENPLGSLHALEAWLARVDDPVPTLLPALDSPDARERKLAAYGLGRVGPAAGPALDKLRERLADDNSQVRDSAVIAIMRISPGKEAADAISPLLADAVAVVRQSAGAALFEIGPDAVVPLLAMLHSDQPAARFEVVQVLRRPDARNHNKLAGVRAEIIDALVEACHDPDAKVRYEAITAAAEWGCASPQQVRELLQDLERTRTGLLAVPRLGDDASQLLPDILALLDDERPLPPVPFIAVGRSNPDRLHAILNTLSSMKTAARPATDRLVELSSKRRDHACISIAKTLHDIGAEEDVVAGVLSPLLQIRDLGGSAGRSMVELCPQEARRQVSLLLPKLGTNETSVDTAVLFALSALGPQAQEAVPAVAPLLQNRDPQVVKSAAHLLREARIGSPDVVAKLALGAANHSLPDDSRTACIHALASIGFAARSVVPQLLKLVDKPESAAPRLETPKFPSKDSGASAIRQAEIQQAWSKIDMRTALIRALGRIGGEDEALVKVVRSQLVSDSLDIRVAATDTLGRVGGHSAETLADLLRQLRDDQPAVRSTAALAIGRIAAYRTPDERKKAVGPLIGALTDESCRQAAAIALGTLGPAARMALPALRKLQSPHATNGAVVRFTKRSLQDYLAMDEFRGNFVEDCVRAAIEEIENTPPEE
jgi:HEAT repeat protein